MTRKRRTVLEIVAGGNIDYRFKLGTPTVRLARYTPGSYSEWGALN